MVISCFGLFAWVVHDPVWQWFTTGGLLDHVVPGEYWYLFWALVEVTMIALMMQLFRWLHLHITLHLVLACLGSCFFVLVNILRMIDRYSGADVLGEFYRSAVWLVYVFYALIMLSPLAGYLGLMLLKRRKGVSHGRLYRCCCVIAYLCLTGQSRYLSVRA
ncbi:hypothetical protein [Shewanella sp. NFH-SH190041]|uniref:hypothetical protein n=1 Tax=Shewanella sp. NFH-SH190041 TaxID=2950245 RepID=UPI0021C27011|nr:hypothetical protein [Shewanella sp. NFH-SH190041]